jgi:hypothetical protein
MNKFLTSTPIAQLDQSSNSEDKGAFQNLFWKEGRKKAF